MATLVVAKHSEAGQLVEVRYIKSWDGYVVYHEDWVSQGWSGVYTREEADKWFRWEIAYPHRPECLIARFEEKVG